MKVVLISGGLGNQLFQYIFYRFLEENSGEKCYLDDRAFFFSPKPAHFGYEIKKIFGLTPNLLSEHFSAEEWKEIVNINLDETNIVDFFRDTGLLMKVVSESNWWASDNKSYRGEYITFPANQYVPELAQMKGDVYYYGYWINVHWFQNVRDQIVQELKFPPMDDDYNRRLAEKICACHSVGVHVRRGDFIPINWALSPEWYVNSVTQMKRVVNKPVFFVFSDDLDYCRSNFTALGFSESDDVTFVKGNTGGKNWRDMQLMTLCRNLIIANSSFSYLAALLNQNPNKYVLNPVAGRGIV